MTQNPNRNIAQDFEQSEAFIQESLSSLPDDFAHPLVSIIMPTYNRAHIISDSIQSALDQSYNNWELWVCDDASTDNTEEIVKSFDDPRIKYLKSKKVGAARARNIGLSHAKGAYIGYLDSDNIWHPEFLNIMVHVLNKNEGMFCAYSKYVDIVVNNKSMIVKKFYPLHFNYEALLEQNFIDLNSLVHRRELYDNLGGFNSELARRQDYDLILKYTFLRDSYYVDAFLLIYQRNKAWKQITQVHKHDDSCIKIINDSLDSYFRDGLPMLRKPCYKSVTVLSWDICRNHFSKAYNMAECLAKDFEVQLIGFSFFEGRIFPPYENESPSFETLYLEGEQFPKFSSSFEKALASIKGDIIYAVKPRLASFGLALLANYHFGKPVVLEINDLESVVTNPTRRSIDKGFTLDAVDFSNKELLNPYSDIWSKIMEKFAFEAPILVTHNKNIDAYFGSRCFQIRNHKDEAFYEPDKYDRDEVRKGLGFSKDDRIILFGGMLRRHKGIFELVKLIKRMDDHRYKLLFVGSRITPDQKNLESKFRDIIRVLPPQGRNDMAKINLAADLVIVWLDPSIAASHYQMPYKITDAFAMGVPVIANNVSDMGDLARDGYLRLVNYDDFDNIVNEIESMFDEPEKTRQMVGRARRLYQRQFSYSAARTNFHLISDLVAKKQEGPLEVSREFADFFSRFSAQML